MVGVSLDALYELAHVRGVATHFTDGLSREVTVSPDTLLAVLGALGAPGAPSSVADAPRALAEWRQARTERVLEPVYVVDEGMDATVGLRLVRRSPHYQCRVEFEFGGDVSWHVAGAQLEPLPGEERTFGLRLPAMRVGYHRLCVIAGKRTSWSTLIVRPLRARPNRFADDWRAVSVQAPIFSLHSSRSWGSGDVADLDSFANLVAPRGASVVATLPLLAAFGPLDLELSPYRPVSRRFWNDRFIALDQVEFLEESPAAQHLMTHTYGPEARRAWREGSRVDAAGAFSAKRNVIQAWAATQSEFMALYEKGLRSYVMEHPEVNDYARFRAAGETLGRNFRVWPTVARSGLLRWNDVDPTRVRYHLFAQWIIDQQMSQLARRLAQRGQTLQLDIPIGVHPDGYDVWRYPDEWVSGFSIGTPPDPVTRDGQSWGAPPPHPERVRETAHRQFREALRCHMRVAGIVRLDHVMGLQRLFWVPDGGTGHDGTYVSMPLDELMAVVAIEAQRFGVDVVGEDLGTVDPALREAMAHEGLRGMYVAQYALGDHELAPVPDGAVASFATHDTPTFWGWWEGVDIEERERVGHLSAEAAGEAREQRERDVVRLRRALELDADAGPEEAYARVHRRLGESDAGLVMVQVEDLLGETRAVNLPGTSDERSNWTQVTSLSLEEMSASDILSRRLAPLALSRGVASSSSIYTRWNPDDVYLFNEGRHFRIFDHLGAHLCEVEGVEGCYFAVWAPNAERVSLIGDVNGWDPSAHPLSPRDSSGVFEGFVPGAREGQVYKYLIRSRLGGVDVEKSDPVGTYFEIPERTGSRIFQSRYEWGDDRWMRERTRTPHRPLSIYEVHLGSWRRVPEEGNRPLTYLELAEQLPEYVAEMGFTHVELLPVMEHPFYGSWGYQSVGYFAPSSRFGTPDDLRALIDALHGVGVGVILDWVPSHFPSDAHALALFDGTHLYEHADERQRVHPDWLSWTFNYSRNEVQSFLVSSASYWVEQFHADGLRVDAVASMLYLDYSRAPGEWVPNREGGREDLDAIHLLRQINDHLHGAYPGVFTVAEESTAWAGVTAPSASGGLGFDFKWDMGWMHDTLSYLARDPVYRRYHHHEITFRALYAHHERFVLALSHDEVVHGKGSLWTKMAGDDWQRFASLRLLVGYQYGLPGKKLLFMGSEFAQPREWDHERSLDWHLLSQPAHEGVRRWVSVLNELYREERSWWGDDASEMDFGWVSCDDEAQSILAWRRGVGEGATYVVANFTPVPRDHYALMLPEVGPFVVIANSDDPAYGGSGYPVRLESSNLGSEVRLSVPPLAVVVLARKDR